MGALLAGPGRRADVVLLDLDLGDGTTVDGNVAAVLAAGPAVLVLSASDRPVAVRAAMRAGARGYVLKNEQADQIRSAIREVAAGRDWISARLAYIFATDDTAARPALSQQETRTLELYATGLALKSVARKLAISEDTAKQYLVTGAREIRECRTGRANENGALLSSSRGRVSPPASIDRCHPGGHGVRIHPSSALASTNLATARRPCHDPRSGVMTAITEPKGIAGRFPFTAADPRRHTRLTCR